MTRVAQQLAVHAERAGRLVGGALHVRQANHGATTTIMAAVASANSQYIDTHGIATGVNARQQAYRAP